MQPPARLFARLSAAVFEGPGPRLLFVVGLALASGCKGEPEEPPAPTFEPGPLVDRQLAKLGGVNLKLPDNLHVDERDGQATLSAEGFPTVTISHVQGEFSGTGIRASTSMSTVEARYTIPSAEWTCTAKDTGDHEEHVLEICESLTATPNPNVSEMTCKTVTGFDAEPVGAAWAEVGPAFTDCLKQLGEGTTGLSFGFNLKLEAGSRSFTKYTSPMIEGEASSCVAKVYEALEAKEALAREDVSDGQIECDGRYSRF